MSKCVINERTKKEQEQLKECVTKLINDDNTILYTVCWSDLEIGDDPMLSLEIKYREHDEVEISNDGND